VPGAVKVNMSVSSNTQFALDYAPLNWDAQLDMFGQTVIYTPRSTGESIELDVVWKEGAEDESVSPGSYSNITLCDADLGQTPERGDVVEGDGQTFDVWRVDAYATGYSRCVLKERV
jgi:hypothetical protein